MATNFLGWLGPRQRGGHPLLANRLCSLGASIALALFPVQTQEPTNNAITIDETTRTEVAEKFAQVFADDYCHADLGAKVAAAIRARVKAKAYDAITSPSDFADALERDAVALSTIVTSPSGSTSILSPRWAVTHLLSKTRVRR